MNAPTPHGGYSLGVALGRIQRARDTFVAQLAAGFVAGNKPRTELESREAMSIRRHQAEIRRQRTVGLRFVEAYAAKIRRELGL